MNGFLHKKEKMASVSTIMPSKISDLDPFGQAHCLVCNKDLNVEEKDSYRSIFSSQMTSSQTESVCFLRSLIGAQNFKMKQSDFVCFHCFSVLDHLDFLENQLKKEKDKFVQLFMDAHSYSDPLGEKISSQPTKNPACEKEKSAKEYLPSPNHEGFPKLQLLEKESPVKNTEAAAPQSLPPFKRKRRKTSKTKILKTEHDGLIENKVDGFCDLKRCASCRIVLLNSRKEFCIACTHQNKETLHMQRITRRTALLKDEPTDSRTSVGTDPRRVLNSNPTLHPSKTKIENAKLMDENIAPLIASKLDSKGSDVKSRISCPRCDQPFKGSLKLRRHLVTSHATCDSELDLLAVKAIILSRESTSDKFSCLDFTCPWCQTSFEGKQDYFLHIENHQNEAFRMYLSEASEKDQDAEQPTCRLCGEKCADRNALKSHVAHHVYGYSCCPLCQTKYSTRLQFVSHLEFFHEKYEIKCADCSKEFFDYLSFERHMLSIHHPNVAKACFECRKLVLERDLSGRNHSSKPVCKECKPLSASARSDWKCSECGYKSKYYGSYLTHKIGHLFGTHHCPSCKLKFLHSEHLRMHLVESHPFVNGLECRICRKLSKNYETYLSHLKFKHPESAQESRSNDVSCTLCSEKFSNKILLKYHMKSHKHAEICKICGVRVRDLPSHMNLHRRTFKFKCSFCDACYASDSSLKSHIKRVHVKMKVAKYRCPMCAKAFLYPVDLRTHVNRVHGGERKFTCTTCSASYKNKGALTYHIRKHTGEKPHQCALCQMAFEKPSALKAHLEKSHEAHYKGVYFKSYYGGKSVVTPDADKTVCFATEDTSVVSPENLPDTPDLVFIDIPSNMRREAVTEIKKPPKLAIQNEFLHIST